MGIMFFLKRIGFFLIDNWRIVVPAVLLVIVVVWASRACNKPPKLDEQQTRKAQQAIAKDDRKQMLEVLAESDVRESGIDNSIKAAEEATAAAKRNYLGKSNQELAEELNLRANQ